MHVEFLQFKSVQSEGTTHLPLTRLAFCLVTFINTNNFNFHNKNYINIPVHFPPTQLPFKQSLPSTHLPETILAFISNMGS